jgi:flagellar basal body L-ring protein FlgH
LKAKHLTRLVAILSFAAFALAGCSKPATNTNNSNSNSNNSNTTSTTPANSPAPPTTPAGDYSTPTAAFKTFYEAAKANNVEGIKRSVSKKTLEEMTKEAAKENKTLDETIKETIKDSPSSFPETRNEKITGDKATLEFKDDKMERWNKASFVKEDGGWKLALADEPAAATESMEGMDHEKK